jgi:hypothetical protein
MCRIIKPKLRDSRDSPSRDPIGGGGHMAWWPMLGDACNNDEKVNEYVLKVGDG